MLPPVPFIKPSTPASNIADVIDMKITRGSFSFEDIAAQWIGLVRMPGETDGDLRRRREDHVRFTPLHD